MLRIFLDISNKIISDTEFRFKNKKSTQDAKACLVNLIYVLILDLAKECEPVSGVTLLPQKH